MPTFWDTLSEENKQKLRSLMPPTWRPPKGKGEKVEVEGKIESLEELDRLMKKRPHHPKGVGSHG